MKHQAEQTCRCIIRANAQSDRDDLTHALSIEPLPGLAGNLGGGEGKNGVLVVDHPNQGIGMNRDFGVGEQGITAIHVLRQH